MEEGGDAKVPAHPSAPRPALTRQNRMDRMPPTLLSIPGENQRQGEREKKEIERYGREKREKRTRAGEKGGG